MPGKEKEAAKFTGENFIRYSGEVAEANEAQVFAWQARCKGERIYLIWSIIFSYRHWHTFFGWADEARSIEEGIRISNSRIENKYKKRATGQIWWRGNYLQLQEFFYFYVGYIQSCLLCVNCATHLTQLKISLWASIKADACVLKHPGVGLQSKVLKSLGCISLV